MIGWLANLIRRRPNDRADDGGDLLHPFRAAGRLEIAAYERLFLYFVEGWDRHRSPQGALVAYPGLPSWNGARSDELEGFARLMPLFAAWTHGSRSGVVELRDGRSVHLATAFRRGLLAGTDPSSAEYWGPIGDMDQRIVEAADVALALWLFGPPLWSTLGGTERAQVARWLAGANARQVPDNNWHLFIVTVNVVLESLGLPVEDDSSRWRYERVKSFYQGDGWFRDGPQGKFDYYNAWGFHYSLYWLEQIRPDWDPDFIGRARCRFLRTYRYLIGPRGFPVLGRSVCYRLAAPAPLVFGHRCCPHTVSAGVARRALDETWRYFIRRGALRGGNISQGYFGPDPRVLDNYSGPGSCLWSLRSLIAAFSYSWESDFWRAQGEPLPVERASYRVRIPATGWTVEGDRATGVLTVEPEGGSSGARVRLRRHGIVRRLLEVVYGRPQRPENYPAKYGRRRYRSEPPFCA